MQIPQKFLPVVSAALMSGAMVCIVSGTLTAWNRGLSAQFISQWLQAFGLAYCVALPTALLMAPVVRKIIARVTRQARRALDSHLHVHEHLVLTQAHPHHHEDGHHVHSHA
jgi:TRAP-type C4-dicarboxylate transport system permease small subunit